MRASVKKGEVIPPEFAGDVEAWVKHRVAEHRNPGPEPRLLEIAGGRWLQVTERRTPDGGIVGVRSDVTHQKQMEQRLAMEHAVASLLADGESVAATIPKVIATICETLGWDCGACWKMDGNDSMLRCVNTWSVDDGAVRDFSASNSQRSFAPESKGFMRRIWAAGRPIWIADISTEPGFQRADAAAKAGLHGAFGFPIRIGSEVVGVLEFFVRHAREPDPALLRVLDSMGLQIGHFFARMATQDELQRLAHYDGLTGLPNRSLFSELLSRMMARAERNATRVAIMFIDLDGFKQINDKHGHDAGDRLLILFTQRLRDSLRKSDTFARHVAAGTAARLGGDEFVVLIDDVANPMDLPIVAQRICAAAVVPFDLGGAEGRVSASIGIAVYPDDGQDVDNLIKAADGAMYDAKQSGKNAYRFCTPPVPPSSPPV